MMEEEYIIISKTTIQKRIEELEKEIDTNRVGVEVQRSIKHELKQIICESTPLIPENINKILSTSLGSEEK